MRLHGKHATKYPLKGDVFQSSSSAIAVCVRTHVSSPSFCDFHSNEFTSHDSVSISAFGKADNYIRQQDRDPNLVLMPLVTGKNVKGNLPK